MLLIFDLDDTLIPTSKEITPKKLDSALKKMIDAGLKINFEEGKKRIHQLNEKAHRSKQAIEYLVLECGGDETHREIGLKALEDKLLDFNVTPQKELNEFLRVLRKEYPLAIVTGGSKQVQEEKIDLYKIDRELFREIIVEDWGEKERAYIQLKERFGSFLVVGDRIANDLSGAKKLGGITIHIRQGRGLLEPKNHPDVDYEIETIKELTRVLERV
ncbi:MAG: HAD family hydrolase [Chlamydiae bacterium]|nr:HAD family hydrolase [Chlamydiota bacterium]